MRAAAKVQPDEMLRTVLYLQPGKTLCAVKLLQPV